MRRNKRTHGSCFAVSENGVLLVKIHEVEFALTKTHKPLLQSFTDTAVPPDLYLFALR